MVRAKALGTGPDSQLLTALAASFLPSRPGSGQDRTKFLQTASQSPMFALEALRLKMRHPKSTTAQFEDPCIAI